MGEHESSFSDHFIASPVFDKTNGVRPGDALSIHCFSRGSKKMELRFTEYTIGSDESCDIVLYDRYVSALHAKLVLDRTSGLYFMEDLNSRNGTFLNNVYICKAKLPKVGQVSLGGSRIQWDKAFDSSTSVFGDFLAKDPASRDTVQKAQMVARSNLSVLILGETGVGKDVLARAIHQASLVNRGAYVPLNCANLAEGILDSELFGHCKGAFTGSVHSRRGAILSADKGTLFLDEVGEISLAMQAKLLRVLESKEVKRLGKDQPERSDFRLITATNRSLECSLQQGLFRLDFYHRIADFIIEVPPLRERKSDIIAIAKSIVEEKGFYLVHESHMKLNSYSYPGNVRELVSILRKAMVLAEFDEIKSIYPQHIQFDAREVSFKQKFVKPRSLKDLEHDALMHSLERHRWSRKLVAEELGISRSSLFAKMKRYQLQ